MALQKRQDKSLQKNAEHQTQNVLSQKKQTELLKKNAFRKKFNVPVSNKKEN